MSYSYQVSKSLFNNRFKIQVGGNYSTDASADENLSQNLISDISAEYILKQTETVNMSVKLFRHTGFESILEGEITETGAGFVMKRKLNNLLHLFRIRHGRKKENPDTTAVGFFKMAWEWRTGAENNPAWEVIMDWTASGWKCLSKLPPPWRRSSGRTAR